METVSYAKFADGFRLPEDCTASPVSCSITPTLSGRYQSIPLSVKVQDAVEFGKHLKFVIRCSTVLSTTFKNVLTVLMKEVGQLMCPDMYNVKQKNNNDKK